MTEVQREKERRQSQAWRARNPEHVKAYSRQYCEIHREEIAARKRRRYHALRAGLTEEEIRAYNHARYLRHRDRQLVRAKERRLADPEKAREYERLQHAKHREHENAQHREYMRKNRERMREYERKYRKENRELVNMWNREWRRAHPESCREQYRKKMENEQFRFAMRLHLSLLQRLKMNRAKKKGRTIELIGCTIAELRVHLEAQFQPGMSWKNHSFYGWHIDHRRPCASFDLTDPEQQRQCFHYTNLQPLWRKDNQSKGAKYAA